MDILTCFDKYATSIIAVLGTLAGVWVMKRKEFKNQVKLKSIDLGIEFEKKNLIEPVLLFLESDLKLITAMYQKGLEAERTKIHEKLGEHILDMSMASARINVYGNEALSKKFDEFTRIRIQIGFDVFYDINKNMLSAHNKIKEAESLSSEIIILLKEKIGSLGSPYKTVRGNNFNKLYIIASGTWRKIRCLQSKIGLYF